MCTDSLHCSNQPYTNLRRVLPCRGLVILRFFGDSRPWVATRCCRDRSVVRWSWSSWNVCHRGTNEWKDETSQMPGGHSNQQWYDYTRSTCKDRFDLYLTCCSAVELEAILILRQTPWSSMWMLNGPVRAAVNRRRAQTEVNGVSPACVWTDDGLW